VTIGRACLPRLALFHSHSDQGEEGAGRKGEAKARPLFRPHLLPGRERGIIGKEKEGVL